MWLRMGKPCCTLTKNVCRDFRQEDRILKVVRTGIRDSEHGRVYAVGGMFTCSFVFLSRYVNKRSILSDYFSGSGANYCLSTG